MIIMQLTRIWERPILNPSKEINGISAPPETGASMELSETPSMTYLVLQMLIIEHARSRRAIDTYVNRVGCHHTAPSMYEYLFIR